MSRNSAWALVAVLRVDHDEAARSLETWRPWKGLFIPFNASGMASDGLPALLLETLGQHAEAKAAFERARPAGTARDAGGLSPREIEVLRLVAHGLTNAEIGQRLFISANTVARHMQNVLEKTGMANRTEATAWAFRAGVVGRAVMDKIQPLTG